ncbi:DSD1 family PLP-dependent enzyme [SAR202 cluster bacterium AD-802-E10_MRT_200m]|nr:DSD1 family PLP-dependent enzyme [SAR202 cluster bacterium AD-802-E10_MRT_200m]
MIETYRPLPGTLVRSVETPCLLLDLNALEKNFNTIARTYEGTICKMRAHAKNHKSPIIAKKQIQAGGTVGGVCAAKVSEAEVMVNGGIDNVLITNQIVTQDKIGRLCKLAKKADIMVAADDPRNIKDISEAAVTHGASIGIIIEVDTSMGRGGIRDSSLGVELAELAASLPGITFRGIMSHQTLPGKPDPETREIEGRGYIQKCLETKTAIEAVGIPVDIVSSGETWTYDIASLIPGVTEVQGGTYALMSHAYDYMDAFSIAAKIMSTVISTPSETVAIGDVGSRALGGVLPEIQDYPGVYVETVSDHQVILRSEGKMPLKIGDTFLLISGQQDIMVNRWDYFVTLRDGIVEGILDIEARGCVN